MSNFDYTKFNAIPTKLEDIDFRSRLEARWALFLTEVGFDFRYEFKTFKGPTFRYTPDFWVNVDGHLLILEVKPSGYLSTLEERNKWLWMHETLKDNVASDAEFAVVYGMPYLSRDYASWYSNDWGDFFFKSRVLPESIKVTKYRPQYRKAARHVF